MVTQSQLIEALRDAKLRELNRRLGALRHRALRQTEGREDVLPADLFELIGLEAQRDTLINLLP